MRSALSPTPSHSPTRSRSQTPRRRRQRQGDTINKPPDSRARQALNLPSDISTSDFVGDTPTGRFSRPMAAEPSAMSTVLARRTTIAATLAGQKTVQAVRGRANRRISNVFLKEDGETEGDGSGSSLVVWGTLRLLWWMLSPMRLLGWLLLFVPVKALALLGKMPPRLTAAMFSGGLAIAVLLYVMAQLEWKSTLPWKGDLDPANSATLSTKPNVESPAPWQMIGAEKLKAINHNFAIVQERLDELEREISTMQPSIESKQKEQIGAIRGELERQQVTWQAHLNRVSQELVTLHKQAPPSNLIDTVLVLQREMQESNSHVAQLESSLAQLNRDLSAFTMDMTVRRLGELIKHQLEEQLPEKLLVRLEADGSVFIDPRLYGMLEEIFRPDSASPQSNSKSINIKAIQNMLNGQLSQLEHRIVDRNQITELITAQLENSLATLSDERVKWQDQLMLRYDQKLETVERRASTLGSHLQELIHKEMAAAYEKSAADGVGLADYALLSMASRVVRSETSATFRQTGGLLSDLLRLGSHGKPPEVALDVDSSPGNCWSFSGSHGVLTIALGTPIIPTDFTIDHLPATLGLDRSSAPKDVEIYALREIGLLGRSKEPILLARYTFRLDGSPMQTFPSSFLLSHPTRFIQLRILSNHGRQEFTCLYRFRVHSRGGRLGGDLYTVLGDMQ